MRLINLNYDEAEELIETNCPKKYFNRLLDEYRKDREFYDVEGFNEFMRERGFKQRCVEIDEVFF
jgi:hypothetical protein